MPRAAGLALLLACHYSETAVSAAPLSSSPVYHNEQGLPSSASSNRRALAPAGTPYTITYGSCEVVLEQADCAAATIELGLGSGTSSMFTSSHPQYCYHLPLYPGSSRWNRRNPTYVLNGEVMTHWTSTVECSETYVCICRHAESPPPPPAIPPQPRPPPSPPSPPPGHRPGWYQSLQGYRYPSPRTSLGPSIELSPANCSNRDYVGCVALPEPRKVVMRASSTSVIRPPTCLDTGSVRVGCLNLPIAASPGTALPGALPSNVFVQQGTPTASQVNGDVEFGGPYANGCMYLAEYVH